jgi:hypothetical protein
MATPTLITVTGDLAPSLQAVKVKFKIPTLLRYTTGPDVILPSTIEAVVAADGTFTVQLYATNDPNWSPANWTYNVEIVGDNNFQTFAISVPYDGGSKTFGQLLPALPSSNGTLYAPFSHGSHVLVLATGAPIPNGTPANTVIVRI